MLVLDDLRFACETCIRGHRSAQCSHSTRTLFEVRRKGRPRGSLKADNAPITVHQPVTVTLPSGQAITANSPHSAERIRASLVDEARALQVVLGKAALDAHLRDYLQAQATQEQQSPPTLLEQPAHQLHAAIPQPPPVQTPFIPDHLLPARLELLSVAALLNPCTCEARTGRRCLCCAASDDGDSAACDSAACACHHGSLSSSRRTSPPVNHGSAPGSCCSGGTAHAARATPDPIIAALLPDADLMALSPLLAPVLSPKTAGACGCAPTPRSPPPARGGCCAPATAPIPPPPPVVAPALADPLWSTVAPLRP
ncbi:hypothetical protein AMAG_13327 [Allomyces macrogynus ATCC 38327]|uniref:Copper-fist domain-containing protein n=1 Tax=Allomyces macrogynus (strain ATCC 38327) TaxID=578462 RepID=A0A0L0T046_ALLM3|nr:hypothetical protein AMAG_13327 [Allomyces macrogynus ATCC 38327]|eukprot:KNE68163.1 hypothetical protein AMAG_13327 [Allomyces macrogynus ATCC 38327]